VSEAYQRHRYGTPMLSSKTMDTEGCVLQSLIAAVVVCNFLILQGLLYRS